MAPLTRRQKKALAAASPGPVIDPADRISRLPDEIQAQILSFLPAHEAVRTCVLARTWRHVWKFTRRLLITGKSVQEVRESVDRLLRVRRGGLDATEIRFDPFDEQGEISLDWEDHISSTESSINRWIRQVLKCQIQTLRVDISTRTGPFNIQLEMNTTLLVSRHLTRLELTGIWFTCSCINMDGCPELKHLEINECCLRDVRKITSLSLKRLVITSCESSEAHDRIQIRVPRLVSLFLDLKDARTPQLARMPELVAAKVACYHDTRDGDTSDIDSDSTSDIDSDDTSDIDSDSDDHEESSGDYAGQSTTKCVVLEGLAQARDLVLIADSPRYIFREKSVQYILRRDLRWCPTFSNLKTLVLIEKYRREPANLSVLECMLEHAPLLEKLTLTLKKVPREGKFNVEIKGYPDAKVKSTKISQHLQIVKINCEDVNGICLHVLNFLATHNICHETRVTKNDEEIAILRNRLYMP